MRHGPVKLATMALVASAVVATACSENGPSEPTALKAPTRSLATVVTTTTVWDFSALAGAPDRPLGTSYTFTQPVAGSITASAEQILPSGGSVQVYAKGTGPNPNLEEEGLGECRSPVGGGECVGIDDEIGDNFGDGVYPSVILDLTQLSAGTVVTSITLASLQSFEAYAVSSSTDGNTWTPFASGVGSDAQPIITIPVLDPTIKYFRFEVGNGSEGNNYLLQSVTTVTTTNTGGGKTFTIGPSSMEGAIKISNGDWVNGGYSFKFKSNTHLATNFSVHATVSITGPCIGGGPATDTFTFALNDATYAVPAGNTNWLPTGDANSVLSWQGSVIASGVCGGVGQLDARHGAVFTATVSQDPPSGSLVDFRFKYRDPKAKGKPNTNCLDTSDPNRNKADVCGASWSQTVTDP